MALVAHLDGKKIDQLTEVISQIKANPDSRRLIVSVWNVGRSSGWRCRRATSCFSSTVVGRRCFCQLYQRSVDVFLGLPFNIASYALSR